LAYTPRHRLALSAAEKCQGHRPWTRTVEI